MTINGQPDPAILAEAVARIVRTAHPRRILLFGSAARGEMGPHSDLDFLVIMPDGIHRRRTAQALHLGMFGLGAAADLVVATESDLRELGDNRSLVYHDALREGREVYRAAS